MINRLFFIAVLLGLGSTNVIATEVNEYTCKRVEAKIDHVNSKMRAGYTLEQGERLKDEFRKLKKIRNKCKKKRIPTK